MFLKLPSHEATTAQLGALYPAVANRQLPVHRVLVGRDTFGGLFVHDPFELYARGVITNPNMIVIGQIGRGKSAFVKSYLYRHATFGRRIVVLDPKGEYGELSRRLGEEPVEMRPGGQFQINPLDVVGEQIGRVEIERRRLEQVSALCDSFSGRVLTSIESFALEAAVRAVSIERATPTLSDLVNTLFDPPSESVRGLGVPLNELRHDGREVALQLRRLVHGEYRGIFDGDTTDRSLFERQITVLDLSALYRTQVLGPLLVCATIALQRIWQSVTDAPTIFVVDEAWAVLANPYAARFLQSSWKLARANGVANIAVVHRVSDLASGDDLGTLTSQLGVGLLADCETVVCFAQSDAEREHASTVLGIGEHARSLAGLPRGVAIWRVASRLFLVEHMLSSSERAIVDTDQRLVGQSHASAESDR